MSVSDYEDIYLQYYDEIKEKFPKLSDEEAYKLASKKAMDYIEDYGDYSG
jgi:hypothetical protein